MQSGIFYSLFNCFFTILTTRFPRLKSLKRFSYFLIKEPTFSLSSLNFKAAIRISGRELKKGTPNLHKVFLSTHYSENNTLHHICINTAKTLYKIYIVLQKNTYCTPSFSINPQSFYWFFFHSYSPLRRNSFRFRIISNL